MLKAIVHFLVYFVFLNLSLYAQERELADRYYIQGEYDKAVEIYKQLSKDKKQAPFIHYNYVASLFKLRQYEAAEKFIKSQISTFGDRVTYRANLAEVYENSGRTELASKEFESLINESAGNDSKLFELHNFLYSNQKYEYLVKLILRDREITKDYDKLGNWLVNCYLHLNKKEELLDEIIRIGIFKNRKDQVQSVIQDNFTTDKEQSYVENKLLEKIEENPNEAFYAEILIWWFAQKRDFSRVYIQARALDKRFNQKGYEMYRYAVETYNSKDYKNAARMYKYIMDEYPDGDLYPYARTWMIKSKEELIKSTYPIDNESIVDLIKEYSLFIEDYGKNVRTAPAMRNMALLQAFYQHDYTASIKTMEEAILSSESNAQIRDECKLDLGDIFLLKNEPWESTLLYMQVEKSQREADLGELAKLKNARLQYYTGQFALSKDILDVLKKATSKEIANDAMQLSLLIEDNTGLDSSEKALQEFSQVELMVFQNQYKEGIRVLDSLYKVYENHPLADEILWTRANTLLKVNRIAEAVQDLDKLLELYANDILGDDALFLLAKITEENLKDKEKAMTYYRRILTDFPSSIYNAQARIRFRELRGDFIN